MIDTHAHLDGCDEPAAVLLRRAQEAGVDRVITIGTGIASCERALALADAHEGVFAAVGIDPHQAGTPEAERVGELRGLAAHHKVVAIGEAGLDGFHGAETLLEQRRLFDAQLALADELGLPIVVHSRDAADATVEALAPFAGTVVLHCFSSPELLEVALERGYYLSFAGNVTFPKAEVLRDCARIGPLDRLLAETDAPYLAPQLVRGRRNEPAYVVHTVAALAAVREQSSAALAAAIDANATRAFSL